MKQSVFDLLKTHYALSIDQIESLDGFESDNYRLTNQDRQWVLKIYPYDAEKESLLKAENRLLRAVRGRLGARIQEVVMNVSGQDLTCLHDEQIILRVLSYLDGIPMAELETPYTPDLTISLGTFLGTLSQQLAGYHDEALMARVIHWDLNHSLENMDQLGSIKDVVQHRQVHYFLNQFKTRVLPHRYRLRQAIIHNDANNWNILVKDNQISGLIDFGDVAFSSQVAEVAVACAYAGMQKEHPLDICATLVRAYHRIFPLEDIEVELLYYFIAVRLCKSLCVSWAKKMVGEDTPYALISENDAADLLGKWVAINPERAVHIFRMATNHVPEAKRSLADLKDRREAFLGKALSLTYQSPIHMEGAAFQYMYDSSGNTFLDAYNNIMLAGHCHPKVVEAGQHMMSKLNTNTRYHYDILYAYAEALLSHFPSSLDKVFFVNSGSAASDLAIRMARTCTGRRQVAVLEQGYHGNTALGIDISHYKYSHQGGGNKADFVIELALPDIFRGQHRDRESAGMAYAEEAEDILKTKAHDLAAFIAEPIVGCGGQVPLPRGYLESIYPVIRQLGGVCISDEVQVGFGRLGTHFWGFEGQGVIPDIVVLGKPMGNGHPIGAVVTTSAIAEGFNTGMEFFSSFGGNPVSCAIGQAVLDVVREEGLQAHALDVGDYLKSTLEQLSTIYPALGDIRGQGLFWGVDLVMDRSSRRPDTDLARHIKNGLRERFILTSTDGPADNTIKIKPPLCFSRQNVDILIESVDDILKNSTCKS